MRVSNDKLHSGQLMFPVVVSDDDTILFTIMHSIYGLWELFRMKVSKKQDSFI